MFFGNHFFIENTRKRAELKLSHDEVRRLAALAERERIGRDLHDLLGHTLSMVALKSELAGKLLDRDPLAARREIDEVGRVARDALSQVRRAVSGIRAAGLAAELASAKLLLESDGVAFRYERADVALTPELETALALTLREAVTNIQRHARAQHAQVTLEAERRRGGAAHRRRRPRRRARAGQRPGRHARAHRVAGRAPARRCGRRPRHPHRGAAAAGRRMTMRIDDPRATIAPSRLTPTAAHAARRLLHCDARFPRRCRRR